jgi:hypothetical protein
MICGKRGVSFTRRRSLDPAEQNEDQKNYDDEAKSAAPVVASAVKWTTADATNAAQQQDNKKDENY